MTAVADERSALDSLWISCDDLRTEFTLAMSSMYKAEVPLYGDLVRIVDGVNRSILGKSKRALDPKVMAMRYGAETVNAARLDIERHGAIRLGSPTELRIMRRVFAVLGLYPVGYYDLSPAGLPMHATAFRPLDEASLRCNPFRIFTSVLRPELVKDEVARHLAVELLSRRNIFSRNLMELLRLADTQGGRLTKDEGARFVQEAMKTFQWHATATSTYDEYARLAAEHPILADITCFPGSHINHLTPRTLDISECQARMLVEGLKVKDRIEGPPPRSCPILLRQTSFFAVEESIKFLSVGRPGLEPIRGSHRARFGEIEERGAAVTLCGRRLYDDLLNEAMDKAKAVGEVITPQKMNEFVENAFRRYPDSWDELRKQGLIYCSFRLTGKPLQSQDVQVLKLDTLVEAGLVEAVPLTYEDFLPLSAAGIFQSNLGRATSSPLGAVADVEGFKDALGTTFHDPDELYRSMEERSIGECASKLGICIDA